MSVFVKTGIFDKSTGGAPASQAVTGIGFQPKLLILYTVARGDFGFNNDVQLAISWTTGAGEEFSSTYYSTDNVSTTEVRRNYQNTKLVGDITGTGFAGALADLTSFDSDGFTLNWTTNTAGAIKIAYIAIGGSDIEAQATNQTMPTVTGTQTFAHGLSGGAPDIVFLFTSSLAATGIAAQGNFSFGAAMSSSSRWTITVSAVDGAVLTTNMDAVRRQTTAKCLQGIEIGAAGVDGALDFEADYVSDDATNVTLDFTNAPPDDYLFTMLAIRGGNWALGATNKKADGTGVQNIATGLAGITKLLMMTSFGNVATSSAVQDDNFTIGATDGSSEASLIAIEKGATLPTQCGSQLVDDKVLRLGTIGAGSLTVDSEADFSSFGGGNAAVNWTTNDAVANQILWATLGDPASNIVQMIL